MTLKVDITDETIVTALNAAGEILVKNAKQSLLGTNLRAEQAGYVILRNGQEITPEELKQQRGQEHAPAKYELKITIEA